MRAGDTPVCTRVRVVRTTRAALMVADERVEVWVPRSHVLDGGDVGPEARNGQSGVMVIPQWLAQDRGFRFW